MIPNIEHDGDCEARGKTPAAGLYLIHQCECAVREIRWIAGEAKDLCEIPIPADTDPERGEYQSRWDKFTARKTALMMFAEGS